MNYLTKNIVLENAFHQVIHMYLVHFAHAVLHDTQDYQPL